METIIQRHKHREVQLEKPRDPEGRFGRRCFSRSTSRNPEKSRSSSKLLVGSMSLPENQLRSPMRRRGSEHRRTTTEFRDYGGGSPANYERDDGSVIFPIRFMTFKFTVYFVSHLIYWRKRCFATLCFWEEELCRIGPRTL